MAARAQLSNLRLLNQPITRYRPFASITELLNPRDAPTPENTNLKIGVFRNLFFQKSTNLNCKYFYKGVNLEKIWVDFWNP